MELASCRRRDLLLLISCTVAFFTFFHLRTLQQDPTKEPLPPQNPQVPAARAASDDGLVNSTLGFGGIIAVSRDGSQRRDSLLLAANLTGLDIAIPHQPVWTDNDVESIKCKNGSRILRASALAWLGHLNALKWFVEQTNLQSALIIEDDVDWDLRLRTYQIPLVSAATRRLIERQTSSSAQDQRPLSAAITNHSDLWGSISDWELLYLGHCGDIFKRENFTGLDHERFHDDSLRDRNHLHVQTSDFLKEIGIDDHERLVHPSKFPLCSFAYAVTRSSAKRILRDFSHEEENHGTWAYDVRLLEACRDLGWKCYSTNPELFHHMSEHSSEVADVNGAPLFPAKKEKVQADRSRGTPNIGCGVRKAVELVRKDAGNKDLIRAIATKPGLCLVDRSGDG